MKKSLFSKTCFAAGLALVVATSCNKQSDLLDAAPKADTRAGINGLLLTTTDTITFEGIGSAYMAGTTSYGDNCYSTWGGTQIAPYTHAATGLQFAIKGAGGPNPVEFWDGGFVVSNWNYKTNTPGNTADWWYSYLNQCSVFHGTDGAGNGGHNGSSNFAVMFGYEDFFNQSYASLPTLNFTNGPATIEGMHICLSSYTYGVIENGNAFGEHGVATPLSEIENGYGYFKLLAYGYNGSTPTNGGDPVEIDLARYTNYASTVSPLINWTYFDLSALGNVTRVEFNFEGNDSGTYGLNTPAYICIDDVIVTH